VSDSAESRIGEAAWKKIRLLTVLMLAAPALYVALGGVFLATGRLARLARLDERVSDVVFFALVAASVLQFLLAVTLRRSMLRESRVVQSFRSVGHVAQHCTQVYLLSFALCQGAAVMGLVYFLISGNLRRLVLLAGASVLFLLVLLPSRLKLETLMRAVGRREATEG